MSDDRTRIAPVDGVRRGLQLNGIYEIDEHIATGGMGEVYRGHNIQTGDPVAIKIVLPEFARDDGILALFRKEASILNHLSHEAIVRYHVFTIDPSIGRPYLAMEFVDGQSLAERMMHGPMPPRDARRMLARVAGGLALAHEAGVIHRDLSPDNIILPGGNVDKAKIIDFGIARSANVGGGTLLGGKFAGKYNFVSPEQLGLFGGEVTERSDIYSLGLVLAAVLRGHALDMSGSQVDVIEKRRALPELGDIDAGLRPLVEAMLQPNPKDRPQSAAEIAEWLRLTDPRSVAPAGVTATGAASEPERAGGGSWPRSMPPADPEAAAVPPAWQWEAPKAPKSVPPAQDRPARRRRGFGGWPELAAMLLLAIGVGAAYQFGVFDRFVGGTETVGERPALAPSPTAGAEAEPPSATAEAQPPAPEPATETAAPATETAAAESAAPAQPPQESQPQSPETAPSDAEQAPTEMAAVVKPSDPVEAGIAWLHAFDGGPCSYADIRSISANEVELDGYGMSSAPFERLAKAYSAANGVAPEVDLHTIARDQCAVADFLKQVQRRLTGNPTLDLNKEVLKSGDSLQGDIAGTGDRDLNLLLVGTDGVVYNFAELLKKTGDGQASFSMRLFPLTDVPSKEPEPHLIVALTSPDGIRAADIRDPELAIDLFPRIRSEIEAEDGETGVAVGYFLFGG